MKISSPTISPGCEGPPSFDAQSRKSPYLSVFVYALLLAFILSAITSAFRKDISVGFDELAHTSYVAELQKQRRVVGLNELKMLDPITFRFTEQRSYLNHPPFYYGALAVAGPRLEGHPEAIFSYRLINIGIVTLGLMLLVGLAQSLARSDLERLILAVSVLCAPVLGQLAGSINNDNLGLAAGALTLFGCGRYLLQHRNSDFAYALLGLVLAGSAKLTALMLCGGCFAVCVILDWRNLRLGHIIWAASGLALAAYPVLALWLAYGSPAPDTVAQHALLVKGSAVAGWGEAPRLAPLGYSLHFLTDFIAGWKPLLTKRSIVQTAMLAVPLTALLIAAAGTATALGRVIRAEQADAASKLTIAGTTAIAVTLGVHMVFSYQRHRETGWLMDAYPRYYLPMIFVISLATVLFVRHLQHRWLRSGLTTFLLLSPMLLGVLG